MTSVLKSDWFRDFLLDRLRKAERFPTDLATKNARPLQITEFMQYRELGDKKKHVTGQISDRFTVITCQFSAECCNEWEAEQEGRRFTELKGALVMADKWEMNVIQLPMSEKFKAVLKIDSIRYIGSEGEPMIGDPRDFNDYNSVLETLRSTSRQSVFLHLPKDEEGYSSQQDASRFETQALPPQPSKRRKLNTEESVAWKELKSLSYKDYQITAGDQGFLDSEKTWVHPGNIHEYDKRPEDEETLAAADTSLIENGHPPLDSPEPEPLSQRHDDSQFHTQAPGMLDPTQAFGVQTSSEEKEIEWEPTQEETRPVRRPTFEEKPEESVEWEASPARPLRVGRMDAPPALDSDDEASPLVREPPQPLVEEEAPSSPASQPMEDEEQEQETTEILFAEDITKETPEEDEMSMDKELSASMKVSTAELLTQEPIVETEKVVEIVKVTETIVEETADEEYEPTEETIEPEVEPEPEKMQEVEESDKFTIREESEVVVETVTESQSDQQIVQQSAQPVLSTTQDDSSSTKYPTSTPSDHRPHSTQTPSQIRTTQTESQESPAPHNQMHPPSSPKQPPPTFLPPHQSSPLQTSPPKATPVLPVPASAQIQVKETPFPAHRPPQQQIVFTSSTTHISATAPSPVKEATPVRRKHKRDEYEGPVVPKFSRREKKIKVDLEAIIRDDLKRFLARLKERGELRPREKEKEEQKAEEEKEKEDSMEEVIEESFEVEEKVETIVEPEQMEEVVQESSGIEEKMDEMIELDYEEEVEEEVVQEKEVLEEEEVQQSVQVEEKVDEAIEADRGEEVIQESEVEGKQDTTIEPNYTEPVEVEIQKEVVELEISEPRNDPSPAPDTNTQEDSQTADVEETRWGRFANHWRRFTRFTT